MEASISEPISYPLGLGESGDAVERLQTLLELAGYLRLPARNALGLFYPNAADYVDLVPEAVIGQFDESTRHALATFQLFHGLRSTGQMDEETSRVMAQPRCGVPDLAYADDAQNVMGAGDPWPRTDLTFGFAEYTGDLIDQEVRNAIINAFDLWSEVTPLSFSEIPVASSPDIVIRFVTGAHGDGAAFDGPGGVLAHAFYPPPNGGAIAGDSHFDEDEAWTLDVPVPPGQFDLLSVAAHEFGHALGLVHSPDRNALMYPFYRGRHRYLDGDDQRRIQGLYGPRQPQQWNSLGHLGRCVGSSKTGSDESLVLSANTAYGVRFRRRAGPNWDRWRYLGGEAAQIGSVWPVSVAPAEDEIFVFIMSTNKEIHVRRFVNGAWEPWQNLGGRKGGAIYSAASTNGTVRLFTRSHDDPDAPPGEPPSGWPDLPEIYERYFTGTGFSPWNLVGGALTTHQATIESRPGVIELFAGGPDGRLHTMRFSNNAWSSWQSLGGDPLLGANRPQGSPWPEAHAVPADTNVLHVFVRDERRRIQHRVRISGVWSAWDTISEEVGGIPFGVASRPDRVHVIARGKDKILYIRTLTAGTWLDWQSLGNVRTQYSATSRPDGSIDVIAEGDGNKILHRVISFPGIVRQT
jgi:hypothetical protein